MRAPPLVRRARELADRLQFTSSCIPEVGVLLHVLAGQRGRARVGEIGTGTGVGSAWIVSALAPSVPFVTVEMDAERAAAAAELFRDDANVRVLGGDWRELMPVEAPFDLLFYDGGGKQRPDLAGEQVLGLLTPGGTLVIDDLTPARSARTRSGPVEGVPGEPGGSPGSYAAPDPVREFWLGHSNLAAVEIMTTPATAAIVAVRSL